MHTHFPFDSKSNWPYQCIALETDGLKNRINFRSLTSVATVAAWGKLMMTLIQ